MTISKDTWNLLLSIFEGHVKHLPHGSPFSSHEAASVMNRVELVVEDGLARLRTPRLQVHKRGRDEYEWGSCLEFVRDFTRPVLEVLQLCDSVRTYVLCLDPPGNRPVEKAATTAKRARPAAEGVPAELTVPRGQRHYFEPGKPMPGMLDLIFNTFAARCALYVFLTEYFRSRDFRDQLPPGKSFVFAGAAYYHDGVFCNGPPLRATRDGSELLPEMDFPGVGEGDVWAWTWVLASDANALVWSNDADVFLVGLLQTRQALANNPSRRLWFATRRSIDSREPSAQNVDRKLADRAARAEVYHRAMDATGDVETAYRASVGSKGVAPTLESCARKEVVWGCQCLDIVGVYHQIRREALRMAREAGVEVQNPVESYVVTFCLSSDAHDYVQTKLISKQVRSVAVWDIYRANVAAIGDLVHVYYMEGNPLLHHYVISHAAMRRLVEHIYRHKAREVVKPTKKLVTEEDLAVERELRYHKLLGQHGPSEMQIDVVCGQCAWLLQYWGNGVFSTYALVRGTFRENGLSAYGFTETGWATEVARSQYKICPPYDGGVRPDDVSVTLPRLSFRSMYTDPVQ